MTELAWLNSHFCSSFKDVHYVLAKLICRQKISIEMPGNFKLSCFLAFNMQLKEIIRFFILLCF